MPMKYQTLVLLLMFSFAVCAQQTSEYSEFKPSGSPIIRVFGDFVTPLNDQSSRTSFEIKRVYLGHRYQIYPNWKIAVVLDIGSPNDDSPYSLLKRYAYFKTAALTYQKGKLTVNAGIIDLFNVGLQEQFWDHRYVFKSFLDEYRFTPRADIGVNAQYQLFESLSVDAMVMNGEGYDQLQNDNTYKGSLGLTATLQKKATLRTYFEYTSKQTEEYMIGFFTGMKVAKILTLGAEANFIFNEDFVEQHDRYGYSAYAHALMKEKYGCFLRYDWVSSSIPAEMTRPWNLGRDGSALIFGVEYRPQSKIKMAVDYQDWFPAANNVDNRRALFLNLEFRL